MVFSAFSIVSLFEAGEDTDNLVGVGEKTHRYTHTQLYASLPHIDLVISRTKADHSCFIQTEMKQSSSQLSCSQRSYFGTCPFEEGRGSLRALASVPRIQSISSKPHKTLFQPVLGTGDLFFACPRETFTSRKRLSADSQLCYIVAKAWSPQKLTFTDRLIYRTNKPVEGKIQPNEHAE